MPLRVCTGFEFGPIGTLAGLIKGNTGNRIVDAGGGTPTIVSSAPVRTGAYTLELNPSATSEYVQWTTATLGTSQTRCVVAFAIRFPTLPAATVDLVRLAPAAAADHLFLFYNQPDSTLRLGFGTGGTGSTGPVIAANTWYYVELYWQVNAATHTCDWWVNGSARSQASKVTAASTVADVLFGTVGAGTYTARIDDVAIWTDTAAITTPVGNHKIVKLGPDTAGTATQIGTANATGRMVTNSAINATFVSADILAALIDTPPVLGASASGVGQRTAGATNAVGIPMTTYTLATGEVISGVRVLVAGWAGSATTNNLGLRVFNGTTEEILFTAADPNFDALDPCAWLCKQVAGATMFDTQTKLNALEVRLGYSTDIAPLPGAHAIYAEVAIKEATQAVAPEAVTATVTAGTLTVAGTSPEQAITPAAVTATVTPSSTVKVSHNVVPAPVTVTVSPGTMAISTTAPGQNVLPVAVNVSATVGTLAVKQNVAPAAVTATVTAGTLRVGRARLLLTESYNKADGPLGPDLTWQRQITPNSGAETVEVVTNQARFAVSGDHVEDLWVPDDYLPSSDQHLSMTVTAVSDTTTGLYWVGFGGQLRFESLNAGADYRAYAVEIGRDNLIFEGIDIWHLVVWRIDTTLTPPDDTVIIIGNGSADIAGIVLPGELHLTVVGDEVNAWFTHSGTGPGLFGSVVDTVYPDGRHAGIGGGHTFVPGDSGFTDIDSFRVTTAQIIEVEAVTVAATPGTMVITGGVAVTQHIVPEVEVGIIDGGDTPIPPTDIVDGGTTATPPVDTFDANANYVTLTVDPGLLTVAVIAAQPVTPQATTVTVTPRTLTVTRGPVHITPQPVTVTATTGTLTATGPVIAAPVSVTATPGTVTVGAFVSGPVPGQEIIASDQPNRIETSDNHNTVAVTDNSNEMFIVDNSNQVLIGDHDQQVLVMTP